MADKRSAASASHGSQICQRSSAEDALVARTGEGIDAQGPGKQARGGTIGAVWTGADGGRRENTTETGPV